MIFASSGGALYGDVDVPASEESRIQPASPYAIGKWTGEQYLGFFAAQYGMSSVALRYANVAGAPPVRHGPPRPGDLRSSIVSAAQASSVLGWQPQVA